MKQGEETNLHTVQAHPMHVFIKVTVTQEEKVLKKVLFLVIGKTHLLFVFMQASWLMAGYGENEREKKREKKNEKTEQSGIPFPFQNVCNLVWKPRGPKKE